MCIDNISNVLVGDPFCSAVPPPQKFLQIRRFLFSLERIGTICDFVRLIDGLAERSKAVASGAIPKGRPEALMLLALVQIPQPSMSFGFLCSRFFTVGDAHIADFLVGNWLHTLGLKWLKGCPSC